MSKQRLIIVLVLILVLAAAGYAWLHTQPSRASNTMTLYGDVDIREVQPAFNDSGHITAMLVQEGAVVRRGELLATLDDTRYAAALAQAKATMASLRTTYLNDEAIYRRDATLTRSGLVSTEVRDDDKAKFIAARQQYEAAAAAVALAQREFHDTKLYAPSDGVVEDRILEPGDMASPGTPVFTIALPSPLWVRAYVPEPSLGRIALGMVATVTTDSYPGRVYHGWIGYVAPTSEFTPKTVETAELRTALVYQTRIYVCDARNELRLGMPATVHIDLEQTPSKAPPGCEPTNDGQP